MSQLEMSPDLFTADYEGAPGKRAFFLHASGTAGDFTYLVEKEQVAVLAEKFRELLLMIDREDTIRTAVPQRDPALAISEPVEPEWRAGTMGLSYEDDADRVVLFMRRADTEEPGGEDPVLEDEAEAFDVRLDLRRDQVRAFILHAMSVVAEGRPLCQLCGLPMDPEGHVCPASNGHRRPA